MKKSVETNSASNLTKKIKNPLDNNYEKRKGDYNGSLIKITNVDITNKAFSSTVVQKKGLNVGIKINKNVKSDIAHEGPYTNRYDLPESHQEVFNNEDSKINGPNSGIFNYNNVEGNDRNKVINKVSNNIKNNYEPPDKMLLNTNSSINKNMIANSNKLESYTKKFGQNFQKKWNVINKY